MLLCAEHFVNKFEYLVVQSENLILLKKVKKEKIRMQNIDCQLKISFALSKFKCFKKKGEKQD